MTKIYIKQEKNTNGGYEYAVKYSADPNYNFSVPDGYFEVPTELNEKALECLPFADLTFDESGILIDITENTEAKESYNNSQKEESINNTEGSYNESDLLNMILDYEIRISVLEADKESSTNV